MERGENSAPRGQKTHKAGGQPGVLKEPEPQGAVTVGYVAAPGPLLEVASMAGGDSVDVTALRFLGKKAIERQKEEEQAKVKRQEEEEKERRMQCRHLDSLPDVKPQLFADNLKCSAERRRALCDSAKVHCPVCPVGWSGCVPW